MIHIITNIIKHLADTSQHVHFSYERFCFQNSCADIFIKAVEHVNPFNARCSKLLVFEGFSATLVFKIFDIRTLWRSVLSARVPECQN